MLQTYSYSVDIAKIFGINSAVFIAFVDYMRNYFYKTRDNFDGRVPLKRSDIFDFTGLDESKQVEVESSLTSCGLFEVKKLQGQSDKHYYILNDDLLQAALNSNGLLSNFIITPKITVKATTPAKKLTKVEKHIISLKKSIHCDSDILKQYLCDWIDAVYTNPKGFLSLASLSIAQTELFNATNSEDEMLEILKIAIKGGHRAP